MSTASDEEIEDPNSANTQTQRRKKCGERTKREKNKLNMRRLRSENPDYYEIEKLKNRMNTMKARIENKLNNVDKSISIKEKNRIAMRNRRANEEYRKRENERNRIAMRMRRNDENIRRSDNERNKIYMQMKRKLDKESPVPSPEPEVDINLVLKVEFDEDETCII